MLSIIIALFFFWTTVQATPTGDHTCHGVIKHPVTVRVNVTEPVTYRTYTWCLRVPPRCSKYTVQMKDRIKVQTEMHNKTITVCCKGYVEMDYICVPACPPHNECPNMHCNRTNHCYCTPGYMGLYCSEPCSRGFWGKDCKKECDCPEGYTCHHLTGDCMIDDSPPIIKKVPRTVSISSTPITTKEPTTLGIINKAPETTFATNNPPIKILRTKSEVAAFQTRPTPPSFTQRTASHAARSTLQTISGIIPTLQVPPVPKVTNRPLSFPSPSNTPTSKNPETLSSLFPTMFSPIMTIVTTTTPATTSPKTTKPTTPTATTPTTTKVPTTTTQTTSIPTTTEKTTISLTPISTTHKITSPTTTQITTEETSTTSTTTLKTIPTTTNTPKTIPTTMNSKTTLKTTTSNKQKTTAPPNIASTATTLPNTAPVATTLPNTVPAATTLLITAPEITTLPSAAHAITLPAISPAASTLPTIAPPASTAVPVTTTPPNIAPGIATTAATTPLTTLETIIPTITHKTTTTQHATTIVPTKPIIIHSTTPIPLSSTKTTSPSTTPLIFDIPPPTVSSISLPSTINATSTVTPNPSIDLPNIVSTKASNSTPIFKFIHDNSTIISLFTKEQSHITDPSFSTTPPPTTRSSKSFYPGHVMQVLTLSPRNRDGDIHSLFPLRTGHHDTIQIKKIHGNITTDSLNHSSTMVPPYTEKFGTTGPQLENITLEEVTQNKVFKHPVIVNSFPSDNNQHEEMQFSPPINVWNGKTLASNHTDNIPHPFLNQQTSKHFSHHPTIKLFTNEFSNNVQTIPYNFNTTKPMYKSVTVYENNILEHVPTVTPYKVISEVRESKKKETTKSYKQEGPLDIFNLSYILNNLDQFNNKNSDLLKVTEVLPRTKDKETIVTDKARSFHNPFGHLYLEGKITKAPTEANQDSAFATSPIVHDLASSLSIRTDQKHDWHKPVHSLDPRLSSPQPHRLSEIIHIEENKLNDNGFLQERVKNVSNAENSESRDPKKFLTDLIKRIEHNLTEPHAAGVQAERDDEAMINFLSGLSFVLGCIAIITIVVMLILIFRRWKRSREKTLMDEVIFAYAPSTEAVVNPTPYGNYSIFRLGSGQTFFCPTFTNNYAEQINRELREMNYDHPRSSEPLYAEISN